jgi:NADP-dependent 3-hydroxy acid dehydrogenase YdfG
MASSMTGKVAFVTGGASGIGEALATKLAGAGAEVWIADRQIDKAQQLAQGLSSGGAKAHAIELDVRDYSSFERAVADAMQEAGRIDYLFNNAGIGVSGEIASYTLDDWNDVFDVNLRGVVHGIQAVYPIMIRQHFGHIVNTASMAGLTTGASQASYTATKHAVVAISRDIARRSRGPRGAGLGALSRRDQDPDTHRRRVRPHRHARCQQPGHPQVLGATAPDGTRQVRGARPSRRAAK